jgi:DNA-binding transcriptional MocR family regulator
VGQSPTKCRPHTAKKEAWGKAPKITVKEVIVTKNDYNLTDLAKKYQEFKAKNLNLDMSRGKPCKEQLDLSLPMLDILNSDSNLKSANGIECRNYGNLAGLPELRNLFAKILEVEPEEVFIGGNSSLSLMFDTICYFVTHGDGQNAPWSQQNAKFLCPVPGYDRHFGILSHFGIEPILVPMLKTGPDMNMVENLIEHDEKIKGIWCVPKYSNPQGITYSDETVCRFANLRPKARDFKIFWDNAYAVHDFSEKPDILLNLMEECKKAKTQDVPILFCSTSKITFPGAGVAALAASKNNLKMLNKNYEYKTICGDKLNQLRHCLFLKNYEGVLSHMKKHAQILRPKFDTVLGILNKEFKNHEIISWSEPQGGYFISVDVPKGCAKRVVELCKNAGVILTPAGATFPNSVDPDDKNIRIAPTFPPIDELKTAVELFCLCAKLAVLSST